MLSLVPDLQTPTRAEATVDAKTVPFVTYYTEEEGRQESEFTLYFPDGGDIPYVAVSDFLPLYAGILNMDHDDDVEPVAYALRGPSDNPLGRNYYIVEREGNGSLMYINTRRNTIEFSDFNAFTQVPGAAGLVSVLDLPATDVIDYPAMIDRLLAAESEEEMEAIQEEMMQAQAGKQNALFRLASAAFNRAGSTVILNLTDYLIDIVEKDGECYVPLQTFADLFMSPCYVLYIYNGDALYGFTYPACGDLLGELYEKEPEEMSGEFAFFNYNELRFLLDTNYGLKDEHGISNFGLFLLSAGLVTDLVSTNSRVFDNALSELTSTYLDDGHSGFINASWRSEDSNDLVSMLAGISDMGPSDKIRFIAGQEYSDARNAAYPDGEVPMYEEVGDTAFITFDSFNIEESDFEAYYDPELVLDPETFVIRKPDLSLLFTGEDEDADLSLDVPQADTIKLLLYAYQMITREDSPIQNVVIDLSNNGGGYACAAVFVIDFVMGKADIAVKDVFTGAETLMSYRADVNRDNEYYGLRDSMLSLDKNVYCLISPNSFSCGNLVPAAFKMSQRIPVVGQTSGGSCVVLPCTSASGAIFQISGTKQLSLIRNGSFYNIDQGIEPDIYLSRPASFYDREMLADYLRNLK